MKWNSSLYDSNHDFVAEYGKEILKYIPNNESQNILDLGCGTGTLTVELAKRGSYVLGIDYSADMIEEAKRQYNQVDFRVGNALEIDFEAEWDIIFSNAVFHWLKDHNVLVKNMRKALKPNGMLICEFGASGNIDTIESTFAKVIETYGYTYKSPFYFTTQDCFRELLVANNFKIDEIDVFDRPTPLKDGEKGLVNWMKQFFAATLVDIPETQQINIFNEVEELTKSKLWNGKEWVADYRRLRVIAHV